MVSTFKSFTQYFRSYPLRGVLTVLTIAIGVGALIITFSLSFDVNDALNESLSEDGRRIVIANAEFSDDGELERQMPPEFDAGVADALETDYENLRDVSVVGSAPWDRVEAGGAEFQIRSARSADESYAALMDLELVAGSFFTGDDVADRSQVVVISESTARILFGSAHLAVGQVIEAAVPQLNADAGQDIRRRFTLSQEPFTVVGVYTDPSELSREAFGIPDLIIPLGTGLPAGLPIDFDPGAVVMARLVNDSVETATSRIGSIVEVEYGEDVALSVWQGSPEGPETLIEESRRSVSSFALTINVLGAIILVASSIGIFSIMLVEVLNRMREIGLRRAIGATQSGIRRFFMMQAVYFSVAGSALGTGLAFVFYRMVGRSLVPFFETAGLSAADLNLTSPGALPVVLAVAAAVVVGALFGLFPAISASRTPIVECIREDAA